MEISKGYELEVLRRGFVKNSKKYANKLICMLINMQIYAYLDKVMYIFSIFLHLFQFRTKIHTGNIKELQC